MKRGSIGIVLVGLLFLFSRLICGFKGYNLMIIRQKPRITPRLFFLTGIHGEEPPIGTENCTPSEDVERLATMFSMSFAHNQYFLTSSKNNSNWSTTSH